ncbi:MAG: urease accessory protein [Geminicoccaceae bacterium]|nr:MAG: urease accessory protein [Geminicoccaceae bacterium]
MALRPDPTPTVPQVPTARLQRSQGRLDVVWKRRGAATVLARLFQEGAFKARLPRDVERGGPDVALINLAGGLTGGDRMHGCITFQAGTVAGATTQAAEKVYKSAGGAAEVVTDLVVEDGAWAEWLPQETILFEGAALDRRTTLHLAPQARLLFVEPLVFGRLAMGEVPTALRLVDRIELRREGALVWLDVTRLEPPTTPLLARPALGHGLRALATILYAAPDAAEALPVIREALEGLPLPGAATRLDGLVVVRFHGADPLALRRSLVTLLARMRVALGGLPPRLPRLWHS